MIKQASLRSTSTRFHSHLVIHACTLVVVCTAYIKAIDTLWFHNTGFIRDIEMTFTSNHLDMSLGLSDKAQQTTNYNVILRHSSSLQPKSKVLMIFIGLWASDFISRYFIFVARFRFTIEHCLCRYTFRITLRCTYWTSVRCKLTLA